jgi:hypothetical protein
MARHFLGLGVIEIRADPTGLFVIAVVVVIAIIAEVAVVSVEVAVGTTAACRVHELISAQGDEEDTR